MKPPVRDPNWLEEVQALYRHDIQEIWDPKIAPQVWSQYHNQLAIYLALAREGQRLEILDIGCAQGTLALLLAERGHAVWAVDIRQHFLDYASRRHERGEVHFVCANALEAEFDRSFDLIYCNQMLEHIVHPVRLLHRLKVLLKEHGRLVVTTPNHRYLMNRLPSFGEIGPPEQHESRQHTADADGHFFAYTLRELEGIFREAGFRSVQARAFESPWISGHMKVRHLHGMLPQSMLGALDRATLSLPVVGEVLAHQLLAVAEND